METISIQTRQESEFVNITGEVRNVVNRSGHQDGVVRVYVPHTTAGITINESADKTVVHDILADLERLVPRRQPYYRHAEGNSASHFKASLMGSSIQVFLRDGELQLGTWQGIFFCEFDGPRTRRIYTHIVNK